MKMIAAVVLLTVVTGCQSFATGKSPIASFVETDDAGKVLRQLSFALTSKPADTCISGDWKVAKRLKGSHPDLHAPAYSWEGGRLEILLVTNICDGYVSYVGNVSAGVFKGEHVAYGLGHSKKLGNVSGTLSGP